MTEKDIQTLKSNVKAYFDEKTKVIEKIEQARKGGKQVWTVALLEDELYKELAGSPARMEFQRLSEMTKTDAEFERYFRSAVMEIFLGKHVNPESL